MSDSLSPLRQVYDLGEPPGRLDGAAAVEGEMLAQMRRLLTAAPRSRPEPATLTAIETQAEAALPFAALRGAAALGAAAPGVEAVLLEQSSAALGTLPAQAPDASALDAVLARAAEASAVLAPVRTVYAIGNDETLPSVEETVLDQMRAVLDKTRTPQRPSADAVDAVLARAASWTAETVGTTTAPSVAAAYGLGAPLDTPEAAVVAGAADALGRLPVERPSPDALAAVLAAAATATQATATTARTPAVAAPRPARPAERRAELPAALWARRPAVWGGALATLLAVVVAFGVVGGPAEAPAEVALVTDTAPEASPELADADAAPAPAPVPEAEPSAASRLSASARALAAGGPMAGLPSQSSTLAPPVAALAVVPQRVEAARRAQPTARPVARMAVAREAEPAPAAPAPSVTAEAVADVLAAPSAGLAASAAPPPSDPALWEDADDVHLLSLRLQELRRKNQGLAWDEPAEAFGAPAAQSLTATPGLQSVGLGAARALPRARALVDTTLDR